jgi:hypothetical protein
MSFMILPFANLSAFVSSAYMPLLSSGIYTVSAMNLSAPVTSTNCSPLTNVGVTRLSSTINPRMSYSGRVIKANLRLPWVTWWMRSRDCLPLRVKIVFMPGKRCNERPYNTGMLFIVWVTVFFYCRSISCCNFFCRKRAGCFFSIRLCKVTFMGR